MITDSMVDDWEAMNNLKEAFDQITTFSFLLEQLQEAVDASDDLKAVNTSHALNAFLPPYMDNFDKKFKVAWEHFISNRL